MDQSDPNNMGAAMAIAAAESIMDHLRDTKRDINYYDLIIRFCFKEKIYDIYKVNELLDSYNCKLLTY